MTKPFKCLLALVSLAIALIPFWIFLFFFNITGPSGFWEKIAVFGLGIWIGGSIQVTLLLFWCIFLFFIIEENGPQKLTRSC